MHCCFLLPADLEALRWGSADGPRLCWSAAPLSLISLLTVAAGLSLLEKKNLFLLSLGPWSIVCFRCKGFNSCLFFFVTCGDCYSLTSDNCFNGQLKSWTHTEYTPMHAAIPSTYQEVCVLSIQCKQIETIGVMWGGEAQSPQLCVIDLVSLSALRLQHTWNWTVPCSPTGVLITLCQYCSKQPLTNQRDSGRQPLIKTSAYHCDSTLFPVYGSDWFCSQVNQWAVPRASAS